jgi:hypothetical protein
MTFPLMSAGLIRRYPAAPGESLAMLYFTNSFGASIGVLASGFVMAAGMAGYLAQGKRAEAGALWSRYPKDVDKTEDVGLRLLYAHAFDLK